MSDALTGARRVPELYGVTPDRFGSEVLPAYRPVVMRGLVAAWPAVVAGKAGPQAVADYILRFDRGRPAAVMAAGPEIGGRFFYRPDMVGFNFERAQVALPVLLAELVRLADAPSPPALYAGASSAPDNFPGWAQENPLPIATPDATPRLWVGNASRVSTHYDVSSNIAAVVAGRRRFVLFPPEQGRNLYVGPLDVTIAGQPTSMVDLEAPDLDLYPRFAEARTAMMVAELEPGDAIFIPSLWWHDVKASGPLNVLVNYWWGQPTALSPFPALVHAIAAVRDLPPGEREAVRGWFDHYVFGQGAQEAGDHLPEDARGVLGAPSARRTRVVRDYLSRAIVRD